jgi:hypothetical protein
LNIEALDKVSGSTESLSAEEVSAKALAAKEKHTGFVAQEVEETAKKLNYDFGGVDKPKNDKDLYGLRYAEFVVPLVKAVQEMDVANKKKDEKINKLEEELADLKQMVLDLKGGASINITSVNLSSAYLEQSVPNPSNGSAIIRYHVPASSRSAKVVIVDMKEIVVKTVDVSGKDSGQLNVDMALLATGTYTYTLYVDGRQVDSKQMIIAR